MLYELRLLKIKSKFNYMKFLFLLLSYSIFAQNPIDSLLLQHNKKTIPYVTIKEFKNIKNPIVLDTREQKEFDISHLKNATCVGYNQFNLQKVKENYRKVSDTIIVYCSVGIRSETIGTKLKKAGYKNVFNLYGGIFGWKNNNEEVYDNNQNPTQKVHGFSKDWSKYLLKGTKTY